MSVLEGRRILLGVTGGIAAYKSAYLCRRLKERGADVWVSMTKNAAQFITPLTMETVSEREVLLEMFPKDRFVGTRHIDISDWTELAIVAPATANFIGRYANGLADDLLTTLMISLTCPVLISPAMNTDMWNHPAVQKNMATLRERGVHFAEPGTGVLACKTVGIGRMAEPEEIVAAAEALFQTAHVRDLSGRTVLVTAGPTRERIDPVRYISNYSSGKMGYAIAAAAQERGAEVTLISGPTALTPPGGVKFIAVESAGEMHAAAVAEFPSCQAAIATAAVSDWRVAAPATGKLAKSDGAPRLELIANPDILADLGERKSPHQYLVGFSLETDPARLTSNDKMTAKNLDLLVANNPTKSGSEFGGETNEAILMDRSGATETLGVLTKRELAHRILDRVAAHFAAPAQRSKTS
ncbi:MAG: bifunctional phosphopantothenoylcysteine decarboxylase/phosphopantothenate--cysteine ligase CoaBC [Candidatus Zixiibacteriota bacterium]